MGFDFRLPNITGATEREQLAQIKSFLHQHIEQLQWAMNNIDSNINTVVVTPTPKSLSPSTTASAEVTFSSIKGLIIKSADIVKAYETTIFSDFNSKYFAESDFGTYLVETNRRVEENTQGVRESYDQIQAIATALNGVMDYVQTTEGYNRRAILDAAGTIGIEVGETIDGRYHH